MDAGVNNIEEPYEEVEGVTCQWKQACIVDMVVGRMEVGTIGCCTFDITEVLL